MRTTERITVTLPTELTEKLRQRVRSGQAESVSGFVAEVVTERLREESVEQFLADMEAVGGKSTEADDQWAEQVWRSARRE
ncbi:MAG: type II toxin-antitoxin system HicB family antitoxin [Pseudonocardia sp.]|nr:type II toxin-antitoxin system HicB family antitoxin [Pseudonocardia sp.]